MATQVIDQAPAESADAPPAAKGRRTVLMLAAAGILTGSAAGFLGIGPIVAKRRAAAPAPEATHETPTVIDHAIENLVLNPAGSGGGRFLMVTATFELKDGATEQLMKDHEAEIRDRLLGLFGERTVEQLTDISGRERLKQDVLDAVAPLLPAGAVQRVFFPQFVIQ